MEGFCRSLLFLEMEMEIVLDGGVLMVMVKCEEKERKKRMVESCWSCNCCKDEGGVGGKGFLMENEG